MAALENSLLAPPKESAYNPAGSRPAEYPGEMKTHVHAKTRALMFVTELPATAKTRNNPRVHRLMRGKIKCGEYAHNATLFVKKK